MSVSSGSPHRSHRSTGSSGSGSESPQRRSTSAGSGHSGGSHHRHHRSTSTGSHHGSGSEASHRRSTSANSHSSGSGFHRSTSTGSHHSSGLRSHHRHHRSTSSNTPTSHHSSGSESPHRRSASVGSHHGRHASGDDHSSSKAEDQSSPKVQEQMFPESKMADDNDDNAWNPTFDEPFNDLSENPFDPFGDDPIEANPAFPMANKPEKSDLNRKAKEFKEKGNAAFKAEQWDKAILYYSESLEIDPESHIVLSNRAASYIKSGQYDLALVDADAVIKLKPEYHKGHGRKGAAYHAMLCYNEAIEAYKDGLECCPNEEHLLLGLAASKRARVVTSKANHAAEIGHRSKRHYRHKRHEAKRATTVSAFCKRTREEVQGQIQALQAQLTLLNELAGMTDEEKSDYLFNLIDKDGNGYIDASELAAILRKRNAELTFGESIIKAVRLVTAYDVDGDSRLDTEEFLTFLQSVTKEIQADFHEFIEFLVFKLIYEKDESQELDCKVNQADGDALDAS